MKAKYIGIAFLLFSASLSGCAGFQQAVTGYESSAAMALDSASDNTVRVWSYQACSTPFSAVIRHPEIAPALEALCLQGGTKVTAGTLLQAIPSKEVAK